MLKLWMRAAAAAALATLLISCGGGGGGGMAFLPLPSAGTGTTAPATTTPSEEPAAPSPSTPPDQQPQAGPGPALPAYTTFALLPSRSTIVSLAKPSPAPGEAVAMRTINVVRTPGANLRDMAYDAKRDRLYVSVGTRILMIPKASQASGDVSSAQHDLLSTGLGNTTTMVLDAERDVLWLGGPTYNNHGALLKISKISAANGLIRTLESIRPNESQPAASYQIWYIRSPMIMGFEVDPVRALVYTSDGFGGVFDLARLTPARKSSLGDPIYESSVANDNAPRHLLLNGANGTALDVALDVLRDRLYFLGGDGREVITVDNASASGSPATVARLPLPTSNISISVDSKNDRLYVGGVDNNAYVFNKASAIAAGATVPGTTVLASPESVAGRGTVLGISFP